MVSRFFTSISFKDMNMKNVVNNENIMIYIVLYSSNTTLSNQPKVFASIFHNISYNINVLDFKEKDVLCLYLKITNKKFNPSETNYLGWVSRLWVNLGYVIQCNFDIVHKWWLLRYKKVFPFGHIWWILSNVGHKNARFLV